VVASNLSGIMLVSYFALSRAQNAAFYVPVAVVAFIWFYYAICPALTSFELAYWLRASGPMSVQLGDSGAQIYQSGSRFLETAWSQLRKVEAVDEGVLLTFTEASLRELLYGDPKVWLPARMFAHPETRHRLLEALQAHSAHPNQAATAVTSSKAVWRITEKNDATPSGSGVADARAAATPTVSSEKDDTPTPVLRKRTLGLGGIVLYVVVQLFAALLRQAPSSGPERDYHAGMALIRGNAPDAAAQATELIVSAAKAGYAPAQNELGRLYITGLIDHKADAQQSTLWFKRAAEQGNVDGEYNLGFAYQYGRGTPGDDAQAARWYRAAAEQGLAVAQVRLGRMLRAGVDVPEDDAEAASLFGKAAAQNNAEARYLLGRLYEEGAGVSEDDQMAVRLYKQSADQGYQPSEKRLRELTSIADANKVQ